MGGNKSDLFSENRKLTISKECFASLFISEEKIVKLIIENQQIMLYPKMTNDFLKQIRESLMLKGLSGEELDKRLIEAKKNVGWTIFRRVD